MQSVTRLSRITHTGTATRCRTQTRNQFAHETPQSHPRHTRGTFHRRPRLQPLYTEKYKVSCSGFLPKQSPLSIHSCSHYALFFCSDGRLYSLRHGPVNLSLARGQAGDRTTTDNLLATSRTPRYQLSHEDHYFWQTCTYLCTWHHQMTTIMQPFQCALQPQIPKHPKTTHKHTQSSLKPPLQCGKKKANRPQSHPPHTRRTFHGRLQPLYTEKYKVSCSSFLAKTKPTQHSCSHYNAFCSIPFITTSLLRHHFPSSPLPFLTTSLHNHFPLHHFSSSPLSFVITSHRHHFPKSPLPFVTTLFLFYCYVLWCDVPPFVKVNSIRYKSFVTWKYYFPTSFHHDHHHSFPCLIQRLFKNLKISVTFHIISPWEVFEVASFGCWSSASLSMVWVQLWLLHRKMCLGFAENRQEKWRNQVSWREHQKETMFLGLFTVFQPCFFEGNMVYSTGFSELFVVAICRSAPPGWATNALPCHRINPFSFWHSLLKCGCPVIWSRGWRIHWPSAWGPLLFFVGARCLSAGRTWDSRVDQQGGQLSVTQLKSIEVAIVQAQSQVCQR